MKWTHEQEIAVMELVRCIIEQQRPFRDNPEYIVVPQRAYRLADKIVSSGNKRVFK